MVPDVWGWLNDNDGAMTVMFTFVLAVFSWRLYKLERSRDAAALKITDWERVGQTAEGDRHVLLRLTIENWGHVSATPRWNDGHVWVFRRKRKIPRKQPIFLRPTSGDASNYSAQFGDASSIPPKASQRYIVSFELPRGWSCVWVWIPMIGDRPARKVFWNPNYLKAKR